jgi:YfiH family protein
MRKSMRLFRLCPSAERDWAEIPLPRADLRAGMSLKAAGDMRFGDPRRAELFRRLGIDPRRVYALKQVHSTRIVRIAEEAPESLAAREGADGLIADRSQAVLSVTVGDCLPIFLVHRRGRAFALLHSGWRGTGIAAEAVRLLAAEYGVPPRELAAVLGPGIGPCCYAVEAARYESFRRRFGERAVRAEAGRFFLDLKAANAELLAASGVEEVAASEECTACTPWLASFRRDGPGFARMVAFIGGSAP